MCSCEVKSFRLPSLELRATGDACTSGLFQKIPETQLTLSPQCLEPAPHPHTFFTSLYPAGRAKNGRSAIFSLTLTNTSPFGSNHVNCIRGDTTWSCHLQNSNVKSACVKKENQRITLLLFLNQINVRYGSTIWSLSCWVLQTEAWNGKEGEKCKLSQIHCMSMLWIAVFMLCLKLTLCKLLHV